MNLIQKIIRGCKLAHSTIECEKGFYTNNVFDKMVIYYHFITDCIRMY